MAPTTSFSLLAGLLALRATAQDAPLSLCTTDACDNCPNSVTTSGTGYPSCVVYDTDTVLGDKANQYPPVQSGRRDIYFDVAPNANPECRTIIRSPAGTTDPNCGVPIYGGQGGVCFTGKTSATFMVQFCCGTGDCASAGVGRRADGSTSMSSAVLHDSDGNPIVPFAVGDELGDHMSLFLEDLGVNSSSAAQTLSSSGVPVYKIGYPAENAAAKKTKRACDTYTANGAPYTKTGDASTQVSGRICDSNSEVTIENSNSVSRTTTFSASVGDPFGIASVSVGFEFEESATQSYSYKFTPNDSQCGHVSFTPFFTCSKGVITGCEGGDQNGEVCTAKRIDKNQIAGAYTFVQTG